MMALCTRDMRAGLFLISAQNKEISDALHVKQEICTPPDTERKMDLERKENNKNKTQKNKENKKTTKKVDGSQSRTIKIGEIKLEERGKKRESLMNKTRSRRMGKWMYGSTFF
jgi:hypothetical protein